MRKCSNLGVSKDIYLFCLFNLNVASLVRAFCLETMRAMEKENDISEDILARAKKATEDLLPTKSRAIYDKEYKIFVNWKLRNAVTVVTFRNWYVIVLLMISMHEFVNIVSPLQSEKYNSSSLWTKYSILKSTLIINNNIDISRYNRLASFLKKRSRGYIPKKSKVLTGDQVLTFIKDAPNETYLLHKVKS